MSLLPDMVICWGTDCSCCWLCCVLVVVWFVPALLTVLSTVLMCSPPSPAVVMVTEPDVELELAVLLLVVPVDCDCCPGLRSVVPICASDAICTVWIWPPGVMICAYCCCCWGICWESQTKCQYWKTRHIVCILHHHLCKLRQHLHLRSWLHQSRQGIGNHLHRQLQSLVNSLPISCWNRHLDWYGSLLLHGQLQNLLDAAWTNSNPLLRWTNLHGKGESIHDKDKTLECQSVPGHSEVWNQQATVQSG